MSDEPSDEELEWEEGYVDGLHGHPWPELYPPPAYHEGRAAGYKRRLRLSGPSEAEIQRAQARLEQLFGFGDKDL